VTAVKPQADSCHAYIMWLLWVEKAQLAPKSE